MIQLIFLIAVEMSVYEVEGVVVTATRYPVELKDVALATLVIDRAEIEAQKPLNLSEALQYNAGIEINDYGTPGSISSLAVRGIQSNGVLVLLNGHPLNWITTGMADLNSININTIEQIEIVKGPVSSLYGANGLGGVINIITSKDYKKPEIQIRATPSTINFHKPLQTKEIFINAGLSFKKTSLGITNAYNSSNGFRSNSDFIGNHLRGQLCYKQDKFQIRSSLTYDNRDYGLPGPVPLIDSIHTVPPFGDSTATSLFDRENDRIILGDIAFNWHLLKNLHWENNLYADRRLIQFHTTTYLGWLGDTVTEDYDYLVYTFGLNTMLRTDIVGFEFVSGIDVHYDTLKTARNSKQTGDTTWHASSYNIGGWLELKKDVNKSFILNPSLRLDRNSNYGNFLSPQVGIVKPLMSNLWVKLSIGRAFRAPTFNDLYWPVSGNPNLKPEHGWAYEMRFEYAPLYNLSGALSLFMRNVKDRIFWLPSENGMWQPQNVNYISIKGLDVEIHTKMNRLIDLSLEGTLLNARQRNSEVVYADTIETIIKEIERDAAFTPKYSISSKITFNLSDKFTLNLAETYVARKVNYYPNYDDAPNVSMDIKKLDGYFLLNGCIQKELFKYLSLTIGIKNFFATEYATQFGNSMGDRDYPMPGRQYFIQLVGQIK